MGVIGLLSAALLAVMPGTSSAERRVALVIGNAAYEERAAELDGAVDDARSVARAFRELDFDDVFLREDLDREGMERAADEFVGTLRSGDVAVFYYAGHGTELDDGLNYLLPVDFSSSYDPVQARNRSLRADEVQARMEAAGAQVRIVILDACRDNPFDPLGRFMGRRGGLNQMPARGGLVAFATEAGDTAADSGLYARHLVEALAVPGLPAMELFTRVSEAVEAASGGTQVPMQQFGSTVGRFVFHPGAGVDPDPSIVSIPDPTAVATVDVSRLDVVQLRRLAEQGDARAQTELGARLAGRSPPSPGDIVRWYDLAASQGYAPAQRELGFLYAFGIRYQFRLGGPQVLLEPDHSEATAWFRRAAAQGDARAQWGLGVTAQEDAEAVRWTRRAAERGIAEAQYSLGVMYERGRGVVRDDAQALRWFLRAAEQGNRSARRWWRGAVEEGDGDATLALGRAAARGDRSAQYDLGLTYARGRGLEQDDEEAFFWLRRSAEQEHPDAVNWLREAAARGSEEAMRWLREAAEQGNAEAQYTLGVMHARGAGLAQDDAEAFRWLRRAAEQEHDGAWWSLRAAAAEGIAEAFQWIRRAAGRGSAGAQYHLGMMYEWGHVVVLDRTEARRWHRQAAEQGHQEALGRLDLLLWSEAFE